MPGLNSKMQEVSAIIGNYNLRNFNKTLNNRMKVIKQYQNFFRKYDEKNIFSLMKINKEVDCTYLYFPIIVNKNLNKFKKYLEIGVPVVSAKFENNAGIIRAAMIVVQ